MAFEQMMKRRKKFTNKLIKARVEEDSKEMIYKLIVSVRTN